MVELELKIAYRHKEIEIIKSGGFPFPRSLTVYPSEVCNLSCDGCNSEGIHRKDGFMDFEVFKKIIKDFNIYGGQAVAFEGGGEPMLNPKIDKMLGLCKYLGLKTGIITNGTIYRPEMLLADWVRVSIHNPNLIPEIITDNLERLMKTRINTKIGVKLLRSKICPEPKFYFEADYIQIKDLRNCPDSLKDNPKHISPCGLTPLRAVVDYDGTFYPCPYFYAQENTAIGRGLLSEIWGQEAHKKAIKNIKNCNEYDCPFLEIDWDKLKKADLEFI